MIKSLSGSEFLEAKQLLSSMLDDDRMFSRGWLSGTRQIVVPVDAFFPSYPSVNHDAERLLTAINECPVSEVLVACMDPFCESQATYDGSKLIENGWVDEISSGVFIIPNESDSLRVIFEDILFVRGILITDRNAGFALLHDLPAEHYVVAGPRGYVEQSLGMSVDEGWNEFDKSVASCGIPKERQYFEKVGKYYRDAGKTC